MIRIVDPIDDLAAVAAFYADAPDYWVLADGVPPGPQKAAEFFTDTPPNCDPAESHHLGLFLEGRLSGLAELSFGFPEVGDAYLGLLMLGPWAQGVGHGRVMLNEVETRARSMGAPNLYLAVLAGNPRGRAFWDREGFADTGLGRDTVVGDRAERITRLVKPL
ncbi:GNAT family N-acetyltransferase [Sulfitobacter sp. SK012]|uniref:GNAT family N-acetyltransferase n=1 Tax=Sulfitobacter sp. SK012 TaxID=1389005 RepID=UPI000E0BC830|nr:GNAT family N-acetyltransferase [Sulfitobacter sp. SK012]AXI45445.1 GNAT family N-acetyltransferase [Sulfitobacter sp. SK012]